MNGQELRSIRRSLGLTVRAFGRAVGYAGTDNTISVDVRRYERGVKTIPPWLALEARRLLTRREFVR